MTSLPVAGDDLLVGVAVEVDELVGHAQLLGKPHPLWTGKQRERESESQREAERKK